MNSISCITHLSRNLNEISVNNWLFWGKKSHHFNSQGYMEAFKTQDTVSNPETINLCCNEISKLQRNNSSCIVSLQLALPCLPCLLHFHELFTSIFCCNNDFKFENQFIIKVNCLCILTEHVFNTMTTGTAETVLEWKDSLNCEKQNMSAYCN